MEKLLIVCVSGGVGCGARYLVQLGAKRLGVGFPYGTWIVNLVGSFLIALIIELGLRTSRFSPNVALALTTGFLGGFTTYSSFNNEALTMILDGARARGALYAGITLVGCFVAGLLGLMVARRLSG
ncbi:MAG: CrcB family protein [Kofleriaceae bacterium]